MDEANQPTVSMDSEAAPKEFDTCDTSLKRAADDESGKSTTPRRNSGEALDSDTVTEAKALSTNGTDNTSVETHLEDNIAKNDDELLPVNTNQSDDKTSNFSEIEKSNIETNPVIEQVGDYSVKECSESNDDKEINVDSATDSQNVTNSYTNTSNGDDTNSSSAKYPEETVHSSEKTVLEQYVSVNQNNEETENTISVQSSRIPDLNENNKSSEYSSKTSDNKLQELAETTGSNKLDVPSNEKNLTDEVQEMDVLSNKTDNQDKINNSVCQETKIDDDKMDEDISEQSNVMPEDSKCASVNEKTNMSFENEKSIGKACEEMKIIEEDYTTKIPANEEVSPISESEKMDVSISEEAKTEEKSFKMKVSIIQETNIEKETTEMDVSVFEEEKTAAENKVEEISIQEEEKSESKPEKIFIDEISTVSLEDKEEVTTLEEPTISSENKREEIPPIEEITLTEDKVEVSPTVEAPSLLERNETEISNNKLGHTISEKENVKDTSQDIQVMEVNQIGTKEKPTLEDSQEETEKSGKSVDFSNETEENEDLNNHKEEAESEECNSSKSSPKNVDSDVNVDVNEPQEENKSVSTNESDEAENKLSSFIKEKLYGESENNKKEHENKDDCVQESSNSESNVNLSNVGEEQVAESLNSSENEDKVMDTEMVTCNEIEQIILNESETAKEDEEDDDDDDDDKNQENELDLQSEHKDEDEEEEEEDEAEEEEEEEEEMDVDKAEEVLEISEKSCASRVEEESKESEREELSIDIIGSKPDEEETIAGSTSTQTDTIKGKDEEVCIIPDNVTPRISILTPKDGNKNVSRKSESIKLGRPEGRKLRVTAPDMERPRSKKSDSTSKSRPVRNAAKLAGNKIKSLVQSEFVYEEQIPDTGNVENGNQSTPDGSSKMCAQCKEVKVCKFVTVQGSCTQYLCSEQCSGAFIKSAQGEEESNEIENTAGEFIRKCAQCHSRVIIDDKCLFWETMDFCNEDCLGKYQTELGSSCANCKGSVNPSSLGKYCVRFGYDVKQFCSASCLEEYKKGLKVCSYCQKDISTGAEGFLAPVGDNGQFKDFCTQSCMEKYERISSNAPPPDVIAECAVCSNSKPVRVEVELDNKTHKLCSEPCFAAFKFVNNIIEGQCDMCRKYFDRAKTGKFSLFFDETPRSFCCKTCMNVYILANRKIVPCNSCKVKKYNFDMIKKVSANGQLAMMCSLNCLATYQGSLKAVPARRNKCDFCLSVEQALQYNLTMSDATIRNFCSYNCGLSFQVMKKRLQFGLGKDSSSFAVKLCALRCNNNRYSKQTIDLIPRTDQLSSPIPTGAPKRVTPRRSQVEPSCVPVISSVQSLASPNSPASPSARVPIPRADVSMVTQVAPISQSITIPTTVAPMPAPAPQVYQQIITKPAPAKEMKNKSVLCKPYSHTKGVSCRPHPCMKETQTDESLNRKFLIPIPVPIYVPAPMHMFATPFPVPVPFPLPVPVPIFIPTTRNSAKGIFKEIKKIQEKIPTDPFEAELLMMAEMVAGEKKQDPTDSESEDGNDGDDGGDGSFCPESVDTTNTFGDDVLQMALKMASELEEPAVDMESVLTSNTITTSTQAAVDPNKALYASDHDDPDQVHVMAMNRGRKRSVRGSRNSASGPQNKRKRTSGSVDVPLLPPPEPVPPPRIEVEKPDANMCLKYTFGVNAWRHWVMQKNAELEKVAMTNRKIKLFKPELLQLTADELNFSLCLFVKEVRKPNGTEYAPDTIYYLCLGIQQYLFENGRIDNIFTDSYYEKFTDCLDEVAKKFAALYNDSQYIVTRVEEEHLWESKQLGAHSPHVLLSTLMFFNTKHFNLETVEEHMQLSFSHIMKHWKRNPNTPGVAKVPGSRNVLLRFYPPQSALEANSRKKKVYEQQENEENPLRCPVKLYEFYLSKCPESVKTRNDVFYLLPERSCVPDSPVWYSTMALGKEPLMKMLHRVKMVKEINIALLTC